MTKKFGRLALHLWTIDTTPLATALDAARSAGFDAIELRRTDFKRCFDAGMSNQQVLELIRSSGIPVGVLIILSAFVLTGIYVRRANREFDPLTQQIVEEAK